MKRFSCELDSFPIFCPSSLPKLSLRPREADKLLSPFSLAFVLTTNRRSCVSIHYSISIYLFVCLFVYYSFITDLWFFILRQGLTKLPAALLSCRCRPQTRHPLVPASPNTGIICIWPIIVIIIGLIQGTHIRQ